MKAVLSIALTAVLLAHAAVGSEPVRIYAHYMPWFKAEATQDGYITWEHWEWFGKGPKHDPDVILENGQRDIASVYYPLIGPYDGRDPDVLEYHFLTARLAGIEGFIADWYGPGGYTDEVFAEMVGTAERTGMRVAICLEEKSFFPPYSDADSREAVLDVAEVQIRHVIESHGKSPAYLTEGGKPVFYMFVNHQQGVFGLHILTPVELEELLGRFDESPIHFVRQETSADYAGVVDGVFAWVGDASYRSNFYDTARAMKADGRIAAITGNAVPGFDSRGVWGWGGEPRIIERRGVDEFDEHWDDIDAARPDAVQVVTWNDFGEGSTIEPTVEYGFTYVDRTEERVAELNGRKARLKDNRWPHRIYEVRRAIRDITDREKADALSRRADEFVERVLAGKRFLMGFRLGRLESAVRKARPATTGEQP